MKALGEGSPLDIPNDGQYVDYGQAAQNKIVLIRLQEEPKRNSATASVRFLLTSFSFVIHW